MIYAKDLVQCLACEFVPSIDQSINLLITPFLPPYDSTWQPRILQIVKKMYFFLQLKVTFQKLSLIF